MCECGGKKNGDSTCESLCVVSVISIHLSTKKRQLRAQTAASLECVGGMGNREPVHSECAGGSRGGPLYEYMNKVAYKKKKKNTFSSLTFTSHTSACVCGHCRSLFVYFNCT